MNGSKQKKSVVKFGESGWVTENPVWWKSGKHGVKVLKLIIWEGMALKLEYNISQEPVNLPPC